MQDLISRQAAVDALWKALFEYEDKMEKKFQESEDLDIQDWIQHRIFVQNMSDIDRRTILDLPPAEPRLIRCKDCYWWTKQPDSLQGRCALSGTYPTGAFFCGNARRRPYLCDPEKNTTCSKTGCYINGGECRHTLSKEYAREEE